MNEIICGVDVSKDWLDAHVESGGASDRFANDAQGIAALALFCRGHGAGLVAMEASGGCERSPFLLLWQEGLPCALVNARQVRRFAEAMGHLEKTDRIDAAVIARYGVVARVAPTPRPSAAGQRLGALVARLCQVTGDITVNKQRRAAESTLIAAPQPPLGETELVFGQTTSTFVPCGSGSCDRGWAL